MNTQTILLFFIVFTAVFTQICSNSNTLHVSGNGKISVLTDVASIQIGISSQMNTTTEALSSVNQQIASLIQIIQTQGIIPNDYSTSSFSITQVYNYTNGVSVLIGQKVSQTLTVKVKNLSNNAAAVGNLVTAASKINGIVVNSVNFDLSDRTVGTKQARKVAFLAAQAKADQYAMLGGVKLKKIKKI
jgi:uncharacterized protein YggE